METLETLRGALLDATVLRSFDRHGFARHAREFPPGDLELDLSGQVHLVTGANSGIGRAAALELCRRGASTWLLCRDPARGEAAARALQRETDGQAQLAQVDLSSLESVRRLARELQVQRVDGLVHNAGLLPAERLTSAEGHEITWATHVLGPHLLTALLLPRLRAAGAARLVWVSSGGMYGRRLQLDDFEWRRRRYDGVTAYAETKRAQVVLSGLWAAHLTDSNVTSNAMHPGWVDTPGVERSLPRFHRLLADDLRTPAQGADTAVWLASCPRIAGESGGFWFDRQRRREHLLPWTRESAAQRQRLWRLCWEQVGLPVP